MDTKKSLKVFVDHLMVTVAEDEKADIDSVDVDPHMSSNGKAIHFRATKHVNKRIPGRSGYGSCVLKGRIIYKITVEAFYDDRSVTRQ